MTHLLFGYLASVWQVPPLLLPGSRPGTLLLSYTQVVGMAGAAPATSPLRTEHSADELHPIVPPAVTARCHWYFQWIMVGKS